MPKVSVIMPAYNAEKYIAQAIESILGQTFDDFEFIIINDCSSDRTEEIILSYDDPRIVYLKNAQNLGVAKTLNRGLAIARGEYIARMDADDISMPERLEKQTKHLDRYADCGICGSNLRFFGEHIGEQPFFYSQTHSEIFGDAIFNSPFAHPVVMFRASVLKEYQLSYVSEFEGVEDYHLWHCLLRVSKGYNLQEELLHYRVHNKQVTQIYKDKQLEALLRLRRVILTENGVHFTDEELNVFTRVCFGIRELTSTEYLQFISIGKRIISSVHSGKKKVAWSYAALNSALLNESKLGSGKFVSWADPLYRLMNFVYKIRRTIK